MCVRQNPQRPPRRDVQRSREPWSEPPPPTPTRSGFVSHIHTSINTVSRLFCAISRAVSRYFAGFADGISQDLRLFHTCFACDSRVSFRVMVSSTLRPMVEE
eukprot:1562360-Prymnesium_polylepis.1